MSVSREEKRRFFDVVGRGDLERAGKMLAAENGESLARAQWAASDGALAAVSVGPFAGWFPATLAASQGSLEMLALLAPKSDFRATDKDGWTVLMSAAQGDNASCARALLACADIDVNATSRHGASALIIAAWNGRANFVKALLDDPRCDPSVKDRNGETAFDNAMAGEHWETAAQLAPFESEERLRFWALKVISQEDDAERAVEALCDFIPLDVAKKAFELFGKEGLPRLATRAEAKELRAVVREASCAGGEIAGKETGASPSPDRKAARL